MSAACSLSFRRASASDFVSDAVLLVAVHRRSFSGELVISSTSPAHAPMHTILDLEPVVLLPIHYDSISERGDSGVSGVTVCEKLAARQHESRIIEGAGM